MRACGTVSKIFILPYKHEAISVEAKSRNNNTKVYKCPKWHSDKKNKNKQKGEKKQGKMYKCSPNVRCKKLCNNNSTGYY